MTEERRVQLVAEVDTTRTKQGFNEIGQQAEGMATKVKAAGDRAQKGVDNIGAGAERSAAQVERSQRSIANAIQRTAVAMESGSRTSAAYYEALAQQRGVDPQKLAPYLNQLRAIEAQQTNVGISAKQTAAALRGVPAQLTDIVTSLQGGQQPLTVFLQQGGQLRDMFGSAGAAAKALGQTVAGLVSPLTIAAAAIAAIGVAYYQGSKEADEFNKALAKSGNVAGTTTAQLTDMAASIRASGAATQGAAAESLAALAATGKVARGNLEDFALTAIKANKYLDQSIEDTAKNYADLGKAPLKASEQLNESLNYLTSSVFEQIKALEDLGKTTQAAEVAQKAYSAAMDERADKIKERLGAIEKGWQSVTGVAKKAWDAMLDVGRSDTPEEKLKKVQEQIAKLQANRFSFTGAGQVRERLPGLKAEEAAIERQIALQKTVAQLDADKAAFNVADIAWMKAGDEYLDKKAKKERELAKVREMGLAAGRSDEEIRAREAEVEKKYEEKKNGDAKAAFNDRIASQIEAIKRRGDVEDTVAQRSMDALEANRAAGLVTERDYIEAVAQLQDAAFTREKARLEAELALVKGKGNSEKDQAALRGQINAVEEKAITRRLKAQNDLAVLEAKEIRDSIVASADRTEKLQAGNAALEKQIEAQTLANAQIGMSRQEQADYNVTLADEAAIRKEVAASILETNPGREKEAEELRKQAKLLRESARLAREGVLKAEDFERQRAFWTSLEDVAHQTFVSIADGGKSAAQRLKDTFKNTFFDWLYQMTVKKWLINVGASLGFSSAAMGVANAATGGSGIGNTVSMLQSGKGIYDAISAGFTGLTASLGSGLASLGTTLGLSSVQGFGMGLQGTAGMTSQGAAYLSENIAGFSSGAAAAPYLTALSGIASGILGGKLISGGYSAVGGSGNGSVLAGTAIGTLLGGPLGSAIGGAIGGVVNRAFGRKGKEVTATGIEGAFSGDTFTGQSFSEWVKKGGWFRSDKRGTDTSPLAAEQAKVFTDTFKGIKDASAAYADALGLSKDAITGYSKDIKLTLTKDQAENEKLIAQVFADIGNDIANALLPSLGKFSKEGEQASQTLQRVATDFVAVGASLKGLGADVDMAFGLIGSASIAARERLVALAGGLENLVGRTNYFSENFLTDEQRIAPIQKQVDEALAALGQSGLKTIEQFRDAVLGLTTSGKLATEEGAKMYAGLLAIAPQFKVVADYLESTKKAAEDLAKTNLAESLQQARTAVQTAFSGLGEAIGREKQAVTSQFSGIISGISGAIDNAGASIQRTKAIIETVRGAIARFTMPGDEAQVGINARRRLNDIATGRAPLDDSIGTAISEATQINESDFASEFDFRFAKAETRRDLLAIGDRADKQLTAQEQSLQIIQGWRTEYETQQAKELAALDQQVAQAQAQIDALNGVNTSVLSVRDAISNFASAISAAISSQKSSGASPASVGSGAMQGGAIVGPRGTPASTPAWWEGTADDVLRNGSMARLTTAGPVVEAPARVETTLTANSTAEVEKRLSSLEQSFTQGIMAVAEYTKQTADTLEQFNLQGMPAER